MNDLSAVVFLLTLPMFFGAMAILLVSFIGYIIVYIRSLFN